MNFASLKQVHLTGIGGISMSAVAKILVASGIKVTGSDVKSNEQTELLVARGVTVHIGEDPAFVAPETELLIYTSAAPETNRERAAAKERKIPELTNFQFLGEWFAEKRVVLVTGTHGKSTTTALLGRALIAAEKDPTVLVGSKVPDFEEGNLRLGGSDLVVIEGDEYAKHFLEFKPYGVSINNIELDHTDVYANLEEMVATFGELLARVQNGGIILANMSDARVEALIALTSQSLEARHVSVIPFGVKHGWNITERKIISSTELASDSLERADTVNEVQHIYISNPNGEVMEIALQIPGEFNAMNALAALSMAEALEADRSKAISSLDSFTGIWRRFESLGVKQGVHVYSDYGHHPTAVSQTLRAAHEAFPDKKIILCFQPHHRNRTKQLFFEFEASFDKADALILCEIYDVAGREAKEDERISSRDFLDVLSRRDAEYGVTRQVSYAANPTEAIQQARAACKPGDVLIIMGAGDIDVIARKML